MVEFRRRVSALGIVGDYADHEAFGDVVRPHLLLHLGRLLAPRTPLDLVQAVDDTSPVDTGDVRQEILALAREYERIREAMAAGDSRTRQMELVASQLRALAITGHRLVPELSASRSPGQRLAAVVMLQAVPQPRFLQWLADRLGVEEPFVGYHAALALLVAVRAFKGERDQELRGALARAKSEFQRTFTGAGMDTTDRYQLLLEAEREMDGGVARSCLRPAR